MSGSKGLRVAGEFPRMIVPRRSVGGRPRSLALMGLRVAMLLGLLALLPLCLGPARAVEGASTLRHVSGMNPGPLPKASVAARPAATRSAEAPKPEAPAAASEVVKPAEVVRMAEVRPSEVPASQDAVKPPAASPKPSAYCASIADAAADARFAWQKEQLAALEKQVEERIAKLESKRAEYESWLARRNAFLAKADDGVVAIYTKMRADAAALQLANMPDENAAAILTKLNARTASAILSEMEAARAAQLARMMTDAGKKARESEKS